MSSEDNAPSALSADNGRQNVVLQVLPSLVTGGVERGTIDLAGALVEAGWTSLVASNGGHMVRELDRLGVKHIQLPLHSKNPLVMRANIGRLEEVIRSHGVDIVHARSRAPAWSAYYAARKSGAHFITTFHGTYNLGLLGLKNAYNAIMTKGERVIAISHFIADHVQGVYRTNPAKIRVVHRGIDLSRFDPTRVSQERIIQLAQRWRLPDGYPVIMLPGRLTRWKGQTVLIEALAMLGRRDVRCLLVGSDQGREAYTDELKSLVERRGLSDVVHIVGDCNDMPAAYMLTDVVVSASTDPEAFGRVIVEGQAMGRPVVATNNGAARENVLDGQTGSLVPPSNPAALAAALDAALSIAPDERERRAALAIKFVRDNFTRELMCARTLGVYSEVLGGSAELQKRGGMGGQQRILVIKLSALGDFVQAMGPFAAIRAHHPGARITLLTTKPFVALAEQSPYFDEIWIDHRPRPWEVAGLMRLRKMLRSVKFDMVYDLQTSDRSSTYFHIMGDPPWSGIANDCSHPHANPDRDLMHTIDRQAEQLRMAGIPATPPADLSWVKADVARFHLPDRYALLVPGGAPHRPGKRWPADHFSEVARYFSAQGVTPVVLGTGDDEDQIKVVTNNCPAALSLSNKTSFPDIVLLARGAVGAVGNDTGPMHLIAAAGCPSVVLFSAESDPGLCAPRGLVTVLAQEDLADLAVDRVLAALRDGSATVRSVAGQG